MELILFRHGIAEEQSSTGDDRQRALTEEGRKNVKAAAKVLQRYYGEKETLFIWSSPLLRAVQTAETLKKRLNAETLSQFESIATGDFEAFKNDIRALPETACLIVTGHAPYLNEWYERMTGSKISLDKGAAVGLKVTNLMPLEASVLWVMQAKGWKRFK